VRVKLLEEKRGAHREPSIKEVRGQQEEEKEPRTNVLGVKRGKEASRESALPHGR